jgi:hypothetical protein
MSFVLHTEEIVGKSGKKPTFKKYQQIFYSPNKGEEICISASEKERNEFVLPSGLERNGEHTLLRDM